MKRRNDENEKWEDFEARVGMKRSGGGERKKGANAKTVPNDILVQRMSGTASGRLKKFEPLDTGISFPLVTMMSYQFKILKKLARSIIRPRRDLAIFWHLTGELPAPSSSRSKVKKSILFVFFYQSPLTSPQNWDSHRLRTVLNQLR